MSTTMSSRELVLDALRRIGRQAAEKLQSDAPGLTGTEVVAQQDYMPKTDHTRQYRNFTAGDVCRCTAGMVVRLCQLYDSMTYTQEPEELPAQWGFYWSNDPKKALPFIALSTSPYNTGDCCTYEGHVWRSGQDVNVWAPGSVGVKWDDLGTIEEVQG